MRIYFDRSELLNMQRDLHVLSSDQDDILSRVLVVCRDGRRKWYTADGYVLAIRAGSPDTGEYSFTLSLPQMLLLIKGAQLDERPFVDLMDDGSTTVGLNHIQLASGFDRHNHPATRVPIESIEFGASGRFNAGELFDFIEIQRRYFPKDEEEWPINGFLLREGHLEMKPLFETSEAVVNRIAGTGVSGSIYVEVNCNFIFDAVRVFERSDEVTVSLPLYMKDPVVFTAKDVVAAVQPFRSAIQRTEDHVEGVIKETFGDLAIQKDQDGDYQLVRHGNAVYASLVESENAIILSVFIVVLDAVKLTPELAVELAQLNADTEFCRIVLAEDQISARIDLVAESLNEVELSTAVRQLLKVAGKYSDALRVMFGGEAHGDPAEYRWRDYLDSEIVAELVPESLVKIQGVDSEYSWPFGEAAYVLTAWNPQGIAIDASSIEMRLAEDIMAHGGRFIHGERHFASGRTEPVLLAWRITETDARRFSKKASQDVYQELTSQTSRMISTIDNRVDERPRCIPGPASNPPGYI